MRELKIKVVGVDMETVTKTVKTDKNSVCVWKLGSDERPVDQATINTFIKAAGEMLEDRGSSNALVTGVPVNPRRISLSEDPDFLTIIQVGNETRPAGKKDLEDFVDVFSKVLEDRKEKILVTHHAVYDDGTFLTLK